MLFRGLELSLAAGQGRQDGFLEITCMLVTLLKLLTSPRKLCTAFFEVGKIKSLTFCILLGSAMTKSLLTIHPGNNIFVVCKLAFRHRNLCSMEGQPGKLLSLTSQNDSLCSPDMWAVHD